MTDLKIKNECETPCNTCPFLFDCLCCNVEKAIRETKENQNDDHKEEELAVALCYLYYHSRFCCEPKDNPFYPLMIKNKILAPL
jgi:hypothetical protein